jgi:hypothetical protein
VTQNTSIKIFPAPQVKIIGNTTACANDTLSYYTSFSANQNYEWTTTGSILSKSDSTATITWIQSGQAMLTCQVQNTITGCSSTSTLVITINPVPPVPKISQSGNTLTTSEATTYQWYLNGAEISQQNSGKRQSITIDESGQYYVAISNDFLCTNESSSFIAVFTSIAEQESGISVYPIPVIKEIFFHSSEEQDFSLEIWDVCGRSLGQTYLNTIESIDLSSFSSGVYFLKITTPTTSKIIRIVK